MPIDCVWRAKQPEYEDRSAGDCFFTELEPYRTLMSKHYLEHVAAVRPPICVMIQSRNPEWVFPFWIDSHPSAEPDAHWNVTVDLASLVVGQKPNITVDPSILADGAYHGYLREGTLTDDMP